MLLLAVRVWGVCRTELLLKMIIRGVGAGDQDGRARLQGVALIFISAWGGGTPWTPSP